MATGRWLMLLTASALRMAVLPAAAQNNSFRPDYVLVASEEEVRINCQTRRSVVVNGTYPGPSIHLREGQTTWIRVYNRIPDQNFTMHWHGLAQRAAPFSDGTPLVSQWPIPPNRFFDYEVTPEVGDAGTYFYHSHVGFQQATAHGALIVDDAREVPYQYDDDVLLLLGDYFSTSDAYIEDTLLGDPYWWPGEPDALTLAGHSGTHAPAGGNATDETCRPFIIDVEPDKVYRLRAVGRTVLSLVKMGFEDHDSFEVIEADGEYTLPVSVDHIQVAPGERYSYLFKTKSKAELDRKGKTLFWVRLETRDRRAQVNGYALLRYKTDGGEEEKLPTALPGTPPVELGMNVRDYLEYKLEPLREEVREGFPTLDEVTRTVVIQVNHVMTHGNFTNSRFWGPVRWAQNGEVWMENVQAESGQEPYLIALYKGDTRAPNHQRALENGGFDRVSRTFTAMPGEVLDIVWESNSGPSGGFVFHPMHVHGEHVYDLGGGNGTYSAEDNERRLSSLSSNSGGRFVPARRDTSILHRYLAQRGPPNFTAGWRAWRIRVTEDNVGLWMLHCHIAHHALGGMNTVWAFGDREDILRSLGDPPYAEGYLEYGGSAFGDPDEDEYDYGYEDEYEDGYDDGYGEEYEDESERGRGGRGGRG